MSGLPFVRRSGSSSRTWNGLLLSYHGRHWRARSSACVSSRGENSIAFFCRFTATVRSPASAALPPYRPWCRKGEPMALAASALRSSVRGAHRRRLACCRVSVRSALGSSPCARMSRGPEQKTPRLEFTSACRFSLAWDRLINCAASTRRHLDPWFRPA
jgi:hypothetical protein